MTVRRAIKGAYLFKGAYHPLPTYPKGARTPPPHMKQARDKWGAEIVVIDDDARGDLDMDMLRCEAAHARAYALSLSLFLSRSHTHTRTLTHAHTLTHKHITDASCARHPCDARLPSRARIRSLSLSLFLSLTHTHTHTHTHALTRMRTLSHTNT